jgi:hypothetical protein
MYQPKPPPPNPTIETLAQYLYDELQAIAQSQSDTVDTVRFNVLNVAPKKPREGALACADGTNWAPGVGAGLYQYIGAAWAKL